MFKIGEMAVYPAQGVGKIEAIETRQFSGEQHDFYVLRIVDSDMTIMVPVGNASHVGLRNLIHKDRVASVYDLLEEKHGGCGLIASWSRRQREYNEKIRSGDLFEVAAVLRELYQLKESKELSYGEKKVLDLTRKLLVKELALADGSDETQVFERVEKIFLH